MCPCDTNSWSLAQRLIATSLPFGPKIFSFCKRLLKMTLPRNQPLRVADSTGERSRMPHILDPIWGHPFSPFKHQMLSLALCRLDIRCSLQGRRGNTIIFCPASCSTRLQFLLFIKINTTGYIGNREPLLGWSFVEIPAWELGRKKPDRSEVMQGKVNIRRQAGEDDEVPVPPHSTFPRRNVFS